MTEQRHACITQLNALYASTPAFAKPAIDFFKLMVQRQGDHPLAPPITRLLLRKLELDVPGQRHLTRNEATKVPYYHVILRVCITASRHVGSRRCATHLRNAFKRQTHNAILVDAFLMKCVEVLHDEVWYLNPVPPVKVEVAEAVPKFLWTANDNSPVVKRKASVSCY